MLNRKIIWISILIVALISISVVGAADNSTYADNDLVSLDAVDFNLTENTNDDVISVNSKSFTELNDLINGDDQFNVYLEGNYAYDPSKDSKFANGIVVSRSINIYGNGYTIDGSDQARIFNFTNYVAVSNINFVNGHSERGSAITGLNFAAVECTFTNNHATDFGGAMVGGYASDCIFKENSADRYGGAVYTGNIKDCTFIQNTAYEGGAIYNVYAVSSTFTENYADGHGGAMSGGSVADSKFIKNSAKTHAGAVYKAYVNNCTFSNNTALYGGALGGEVSSVENSLFEYNSAVDGGAMYMGTARNSIFRYNSATNGGAKYLGSAVSCIFDYNHATNGGAIMETYALNCNLSYNHADKGGAMYDNSAVNCLFTYNTADYGGAMYGSHSDESKFYSNTATIQGGAIDAGGADSSEFRDNHAVNGGAVSSSDVLSCTFIDNVADEKGGGAYKTSARGSGFKHNTAKYGGGIAEGSASECSFMNNVAKVTGGAKYESYVVDSEFDANSPVYKLYVSDFTGIEGFGGDINIKLSDSPSYFVTGVNATIKIYNSKNKLIGTYFSEVGYNWFVNLAAGSYKATISVEDACYDVDPVKININIQKSSFIYAASVSTNYQAGKLLIVNLHDSAGNAIKYEKVSVKLNGATKTYVTDANGQVMVPTKTLKPGTYTVTITYAGSSTYLKSTATAKITVNKLTPKLTAAKATFKLKDKTKKYTVTLKTDKNVVMKSTKVTVKVNGKTYSVKTNAKGQAIFKLTKLTKKGTFSAVVTYAGSSIYKSLSKTVKLTVK